MELNNSIMTGILVILGIAALVGNIYFGKRKIEKTPLGKVTSIILDARHNLRVIQNFKFHRGVKKLKTRSWTRNRDKVDFLPMELLSELSQVFDMSEDINQRIEAARKFKSDSYMAGIDVSKLEAPLEHVIPPLQEWLQENMSNPDYAPKRRGLFS